LKEDNQESVDEQKDEETVAGMYEDSNSHVHEEWRDSVEEDPEIHEECTGRREHIDEENEEDDIRKKNGLVYRATSLSSAM
jgi:hypothetical protein